MINTKFWSDTYIANIDPLEKLLFLYFITNSYTNICGIYEIPIKQIALDTGIDKENLEKVFLPRFAKAKKIYYINGWVYIKNFLKHQKASGNVKLGIENGLKEVPSEIMAKISKLSDTPPTQGKHSLKLELESELESELEVEDRKKIPPPKKEKQDYKIIDEFLKEIQTILGATKWASAQQWTRVYAQKCLKEYGKEKTLEAVKWMKGNWNSIPTQMKTIYHGIVEYEARKKSLKVIDLSK